MMFFSTHLSSQTLHLHHKIHIYHSLFLMYSSSILYMSHPFYICSLFSNIPLLSTFYPFSCFLQNLNYILLILHLIFLSLYLLFLSLYLYLLLNPFHPLLIALINLLPNPFYSNIHFLVSLSILYVALYIHPLLLLLAINTFLNFLLSLMSMHNLLFLSNPFLTLQNIHCNIHIHDNNLLFENEKNIYNHNHLVISFLLILNNLYFLLIQNHPPILMHSLHYYLSYHHISYHATMHKLFFLVSSYRYALHHYTNNTSCLYKINYLLYKIFLHLLILLL